MHIPYKCVLLREGQKFWRVVYCPRKKQEGEEEEEADDLLLYL